MADPQVELQTELNQEKPIIEPDRATAPPAEPSHEALNQSLPTVYDMASKARGAGYSWDEINSYLADSRQKAVASGYTNEEVNDYLGLPKTVGTLRFQQGDQGPVATTYADNLPGNIRAFADTYLTPSADSGEPRPPIKTAGDLVKAAGWDIVDLGKIFGRPVVSGAAAVMEGLDGQPRTQAEMEALGQEAQPFLGVLASPFRVGPGQLAKPSLPPVKDFVDAATALKPENLSDALKGLGQHYVETGESPIKAATRALQDPALADQLKNVKTPAPDGGPSFDQAVDRVLQVEGGPTTDTGGRTIYGISEKANPDVWANGPPTLDQARQIYKERYWDAIKADELPANIRLDAFDAAVNEGVGKAKEMLAVSKGDPAVFDRLRRDHYEALASADPVKYEKYLMGWENRLKEMPFASILAQLNDLALVGKFATKLAGSTEGALKDVPSETEQAIARYPRDPVPDLPITPETITLRDPGLSTSILDDFRRAFSPYNRSPEASEAAGIIREKLAQDAVFEQRTINTFRAFDRSILELPVNYRYDWVHAYETGDIGKFEGHPLGAVATFAHNMFDRMWGQLNDRDIVQSYVENYLSRGYKNPKKAQQFFSKSFAGNQAFTKERYYATMREAIDAGHAPRFDNPFKMMVAGIVNMNKAITAHDAMKSLQEAKLALSGEELTVLYGDHQPPGIVRLDPRIARLGGKAFYAPEQVATIFNRAYSPGLGQFTSYRAMRSVANTMNMVQLSMSAFHGGFVISDAFTSAIAKGVKQISRATPAEVLEGFKSLAVSPVKPVLNLIQGRALIRQVLGQADYGPHMQSLADALVAGGGRVGTQTAYTAESAYGSFWRSFRGSLQRMAGEPTGEMTLSQNVRQMWADALGPKTLKPNAQGIYEPQNYSARQYSLAAISTMAQMAPRLVDTLMAPLFEQLIPTMKAGVFADLMSDELRVNPNMTPTELRAAAFRVWNSVDNRLGQIVYDNTFWNKTMLDIGHLGIRAQGWLAGEIREIPGGAINLVKGRPISAGEMKQIHENSSYVIAMAIKTVLVGGVMGALYGTWNPNWGLLDYAFPPKPDGSRASPPGYERDTYNWIFHPVTEAENKVHPLLSGFYDMMQNRDWFGAAIADPRGSMLDKAEDYGQFLYHQFEPIILKQLHQMEAGTIDKETFIENIFGVKQAPYEIRNPEAAGRSENRDTRGAVRKKAREVEKGEF